MEVANRGFVSWNLTSKINFTENSLICRKKENDILVLHLIIYLILHKKMLESAESSIMSSILDMY